MSDRDRITFNDIERRGRALTAMIELSSNPYLSIQHIAEAAAVSRSELYRLFKNDGGIECFLIQLRIAGLRDALMQPGDKRTFGQIARAHGFKSVCHASRSFKAAYGISPSRFRRQHRESSSYTPSLSTANSASVET